MNKRTLIMLCFCVVNSAIASEKTNTQIILTPAKTPTTAVFTSSSTITNSAASNENVQSEQLTGMQQQTRAALANQPPSNNDVIAADHQKLVAQAAKQMISPLSPQEVITLRQLQDRMSRAAAYTPVSLIPKISSLTLDLSTGSAIPVVRVAPGQGSLVTFEDITGQPWPLASEPINSDPSFAVTWFTDTHTIHIQPTKGYGNGNIAVVLRDLPTPIAIVLANGEPESNKKTRTFDQRISFRIPARGPNAKKHPITHLSKIGIYDEELQSLLDGIPPKNAQLLKTDNTQLSVWKMENKLYIRTRLEAKSIFSKTLSSSDGTHVYEMDLTPFITLSDGMNIVNVKVIF
ncbi:DotH/IcmK family type IV secretion protein [Xenorhabdus nematophila]|uniref:DotH/IcmK family type IV secretion protein n=1 Tax=Xenorhabdus nematophila TaxID=628 RepID=UPI0032B735F1